MEKACVLASSVLSYAVAQEKRLLHELEKELSGMPEGRLSICRKGNSVFFTETRDGKRRGITRDLDRVYKLARKRYLQYVCERISLELRTTGKTSAGTSDRLDSISSRISSLLDNLSGAGLDISRITLTPKQYEWMHKEYLANSAYPEALQYTTNSGLVVRSKSERTIANRLTEFGLPFRYEQALELDVSSMQGLRGTRMGKYKTYYPDFIIMAPSGEMVIWEHLGLIDKPEYRESNYEKLFVYRHLGRVSEKRMITTFERDLAKISTIDDIIIRRILLG